MGFANRIVQAVAVLMGPNAHHVDPFILSAESGSLVVIVLFAKDPENTLGTPSAIGTPI